MARLLELAVATRYNVSPIFSRFNARNIWSTVSRFCPVLPLASTVLSDMAPGRAHMMLPLEFAIYFGQFTPFLAYLDNRIPRRV